MDERTVDIVLVGVGNLGRRFTQLLADKAAYLKTRYGIAFRLIGVADSRGVAHDPAGLDPEIVVRIKNEGRSVGEYPNAGQMNVTATELVREVKADLLCEASPVHLKEGGEPGLSCIRTALSRGMHVVTPNKGPIVLAYQELVDAASAHGVKLRFDGTVAGGLPALYLGMRDLRGAIIERIEAVPNVVTGYILDLLAEGTRGEDALARAPRSGEWTPRGRSELGRGRLGRHSETRHSRKCSPWLPRKVGGRQAGRNQWNLTGEDLQRSCSRPGNPASRRCRTNKRRSLYPLCRTEGASHESSARPPWLLRAWRRLLHRHLRNDHRDHR